MPQPSRASRILKWIGALICASILVARQSDLEVGIPIGARGYFIKMANFFLVGLQNDLHKDLPNPIVRMPHPDWKGGNLTWPQTFVGGSRHRTELAIPFWFAFITVALPTVFFFYRDRRRIRPGCCLRCGYDLTGNTSGVCSECGLHATLAPVKAGR